MVALALVEGRLHPPKPPPVPGVEAESVKEALATDQRHVPEAGNPIGVLLDGEFSLELLEQGGSLLVARQMPAQRGEAGHHDRRADEQHRLALAAAEGNLVRGPYA